MDHPAAITGRDYTAALPTELLLSVLSELSFDALWPFLAVSSRWRAAAMHAPAYWSSVHLKGLTEGAVNLFVARLSRAGSRPVSLTINLKDPDPAPRILLKRTLITLLEHAAHLKSLVISLRSTTALDIWPSLMCAAPHLGYVLFDVHPTLAGEALPVVPLNLFAGSAPRLKTLILANVDFPPQPVTAFLRVPTPVLHYTVPYVMPDFFAHFPSATTVDFPDVSYRNPVFHAASSYRNIKHCILRTDNRVHGDRIPLSVLHELEYVHLYQPHPSEIERLLDHVPALLSLIVSPDLDNGEEDFELAVSDTHKRLGRWRFIIDQVARWSRERHDESTLRDALRDALADRVFDLYADAAYWPTLAQVLPPIAGLQVLQLEIRRENDLAALFLAEFVPGDLYMLSLGSKACIVLPSDQLVTFATHSFGSHMPRLALANIHMTGDLGALRACFADFEFLHSAPCRCQPWRCDLDTGFIALAPNT